MLAVIKPEDYTQEGSEKGPHESPEDRCFSVTRASASLANNNGAGLLTESVGFAEEASDFVAFISCLHRPEVCKTIVELWKCAGRGGIELNNR